MEQEPRSASLVTNTEQHSVNTENQVTQDSGAGGGGAENQKKEKVLLQARNQMHGGAQGVLPRHKGIDYRRCFKRNWQRRRRNNGTMGLTIYGP
jgi:hypothetical protein